VVPQDLGDGPGALGDERVVARVARGELGDVSAGNGMVVAPRDQRRPRRRAERCRVIHVVAKTIVGDAWKFGVWIGPPKVLLAPKPTSSVRIRSTLGAPAGASTPFGKSGVESLTVRPIRP